MTARELVLNFVNQYNKPFDSPLVANMTGLEIGELEPIISELLEDETIRLASHRESIYVRSNRFNTTLDKQLRAHWSFDPKAALALLDLIEKRSFTSIRSIAEAFGRSRQWVFVYLEAMASVKVIGINKSGYCVLDHQKIPMVGSIVIKGILGEMRSKAGMPPKQRAPYRTKKRMAQHPQQAL